MTDMTRGVTARMERKGGGMGKWMFFQPYYSHINSEPFLKRFVIFFTPLAGLHITRICMADNQREWPHDHSASFLSIKFGWYEEDVYTDPADLSQKRHVRHGRFSCHLLRYTEAHSITEVSPHLVTILLLGPRRQKSNYWTPDGKQSLGMKMDK